MALVIYHLVTTARKARMSKLNVDQKSVFELFFHKKADFLIPDYQRPYAWDEDQCQTLWDDLFEFAFPNDNADDFNENEEYYLGAIVTYKNEREQSEIIDGQQRITTLMLLLRAFYDRFQNMQDSGSVQTKKRIAACIWKTNPFGEPLKDELKLSSEVATDEDRDEFMQILMSGVTANPPRSQYAQNFVYFKQRIESFLNDYPSYFAYFPTRILNNCILLPIEAESQDTALRIFSTLNDRGLPLSDADIFKAQFYKYYGGEGQKDAFIDRWKTLEEVTSRIFRPTSGTPMDELFTRYMYYLRAKEGIKKTTTEALRKFYERNRYQYLTQDSTLEDLERVGRFWEAVNAQDSERFSNDILKKLFVLHYSPNGMWLHMVTAYFLANHVDGVLAEPEFGSFLERITAFTFAYAIAHPGVGALRTPAFDEMLNIVNHREVTFSKFRLPHDNTRRSFENYQFTNHRDITRSMITWYAFTFPNQELPRLDDNYQIEHIFAKKRQERMPELSDERMLELLGNKVLLERHINIRASDYRFEDKKNIYMNARQGRKGHTSEIAEIKELIHYNEFGETELLARNQKILDAFFAFLADQDLLE